MARPGRGWPVQARARLRRLPRSLPLAFVTALNTLVRLPVENAETRKRREGEVRELRGAGIARGDRADDDGPRQTAGPRCAGAGYPKDASSQGQGRCAGHGDGTRDTAPRAAAQ